MKIKSTYAKYLQMRAYQTSFGDIQQASDAFNVTQLFYFWCLINFFVLTWLEERIIEQKERTNTKGEANEATGARNN
jgi:hypothetical protein